MYKSRDFFTYTLNPTNTPGFASIAAGGQATGALNIEQDSDFQLVKMSYFCQNGSDDNNELALRALPLATVNIQDTGSGRYLMNGPVALTDLFGTGELPFILPEDKIFVARATIFVQVANYGSSDAVVNLYLSFIGIKNFL